MAAAAGRFSIRMSGIISAWIIPSFESGLARINPNSKTMRISKIPKRQFSKKFPDHGVGKAIFAEKFVEQERICVLFSRAENFRSLKFVLDFRCVYAV